jgi:3-oxoacyl-[acyl-carrier protein] reductase
MAIKRKILILGGSSDIGVEVINIFMKKNWSITAHYNSNLNALKKFKGKIKLIKFDFENKKNVEKLINKKFESNFHSIINLIGYVDNKSFKNTDYISIIKALTVNAVLPSLVIRKTIPFMLKEKWGRIVNGSSLGIAYGGGENSYNYSLSKHLMEFIPGVYRYWAENNVLINNLRIGYTNTKIHKKINKTIKGKKRINLIPMKRMARPLEMANYLAFLASEENSFMTNRTLSATGGE